MDTRFLASFVCVVENGSIAEAARRLSLTPAGVARQVHALEDDMGVRLVFRSGRRVKPTQAGLAVAARARSFLAEARDLRSAATDDQLSGEFRLGAMPTAISGLLPDLLSVWSRKYPEVEVRMTRATSSELYRRVIDGDLDAAITAQPPFAIPKTCGWQLLREEPLILLVPAAMRGRDPYDLLRSEPFIRNERNTWAGRLVDAYLRRTGIQPRERFELAGLDLVAVLVDRGLGVSLMHDSEPLWLSGLSVAKILLPKNPFSRRTGLLWPRASVRVRLAVTFLGEAKRIFGSGRLSSRKKTVRVAPL